MSSFTYLLVGPSTATKDPEYPKLGRVLVSGVKIRQAKENNKSHNYEDGCMYG